MGSKVCRKCGEAAQDKFYVNSKTQCKSCIQATNAAWNAANPGRRDAASVAWKLANPERVAATRAAWKLANPERVAAARAAWRAANVARVAATCAAWEAANSERRKTTTAAWESANKERRDAQFAAYRITHRDSRAAYNSAWSAANPARVRDKNLRRRARKANATLGDPADTTAWIQALAHDPCCYCGAPISGTVDHIVPLHTGGSHDWENLTAACSSCNSSKGTKSLLEFLALR